MRLLDADKLKPKIKYIAKSYGMGAFTKEKLLDAIDKCAIEAEPVRHGEWVFGEFDIPHCSECGTEIAPHEISQYCPFCGAKMDLEE
jgi:hypothetical protein|nr:MAG TPA: Putative toxin VapC6 domain, ZN ribbon domain [Caudoviricetes sp.]